MFGSMLEFVRGAVRETWKWMAGPGDTAWIALAMGICPCHLDGQMVDLLLETQQAKHRAEFASGAPSCLDMGDVPTIRQD